MWNSLEAEFILGMQKAAKHKTEHQPLHVGDLVYLISETININPTERTYPGHVQSRCLGRYKIGKVVQVQRGRDNLDRVFWIKHGLEGENWTAQQLMQNETRSKISLMSYMNLFPVEKV